MRNLHAVAVDAERLEVARVALVDLINGRKTVEALFVTFLGLFLGVLFVSGLFFGRFLGVLLLSCGFGSFGRRSALGSFFDLCGLGSAFGRHVL